MRAVSFFSSGITAIPSVSFFGSKETGFDTGTAGTGTGGGWDGDTGTDGGEPIGGGIGDLSDGGRGGN